MAGAKQCLPVDEGFSKNGGLKVYVGDGKTTLVGVGD